MLDVLEVIIPLALCVVTFAVHVLTMACTAVLAAVLVVGVFWSAFIERLDGLDGSE
jgi:hypothetical protein